MSILAKLAPDQIADSILDLDPAALRAEGVRAALLDIDNTLAAWNSLEVRDDIRQWLTAAQEHLTLCLLSNSSKTGRMGKLRAMLGIEVIQGFPVGKPWPVAYRRALAVTGTSPAETVMIGDQLLTDVFGANLQGLRTILVRPLGTNEFIGTKLTRVIESLTMALLRRRGLLPATPDSR